MISIEPASAVPPFEQVRARIASDIASGELPPGARLPTVRTLAGELGLAVNTVARAYRELEAAGLVSTRGRAGTVVEAPDAATARVRDAARRLALAVHAAGMTDDEALRMLRAVLDAD